MLYSYFISEPKAKTDLEKEVIVLDIRTFQMDPSIVVSRAISAYGPSFDASHPKTDEERNWAAEWQTADKWRVCRSIDQEWNLHSEMLSIAKAVCCKPGIKGINRIKRQFEEDRYPAILTKNYFGKRWCPWRNSTDPGKKKREVYSLSDDAEQTISGSFPLLHIYNRDKYERFMSFDELILAISLRGWTNEQIFVNGMNPGYGWLLYPLDLVLKHGNRLHGMTAVEHEHKRCYGTKWNDVISSIERAEDGFYSNHPDEYAYMV